MAINLKYDELRLIQTALRTYRKKSIKMRDRLKEKFGKDADLTDVNKKITMLISLEEKIKEEADLFE